MANNAFGMQGLSNLSAQIKGQDKVSRNAVRKNLRVAVKAAGQPIVDQIKQNASWSTTIPGAVAMTIRYSTNGASIRIQVNHNKARHARPYEMGNKTNFDEDLIGSIVAKGGKVHGIDRVSRRKAIATARKRNGAAAVTGKDLRWPVYHAVDKPGGWGETATRPFFQKAIEAKAKNSDQVFEKVVVKIATDAGFKVV